MNFLNQAKATADKILNNNTKGGSPMTNPFIKNNTPINSTSSVAAPVAKPVSPTTTAPVAPAAKPVTPVAKPVVPPVAAKPGVPPIGKPGVPPTAKPGVPPVAKPSVPGAIKPPTPAKPVVSAPVVEEETANDIANKIVEEVEAKVETTVDTHEVANKVVNSEEAKKEIAEEVAKVVEEKKEEEVKEEKELTPQQKAAQTRKRRAEEAKKKASTVKESIKDTITDKIEENSQVEIVIPTTDVSYADALVAVKSNFVDEQWEAFRNKVTQTNAEIMITNDMNKAQLHDLLAQVAVLRDEVAIVNNDTKTLYENLTAKDDGLIDRVKRLNSRGSNAEERKVSGTLAVMSHKAPDGSNINLYEVLEETRSRYNFLKCVMETIEFKKSVLLTMLSSLKMEK